MVCEPKRRTTSGGSLQFPNRFSRNFWVLSIMPNILEISVGIQKERFVSVSSDRNIRDHLWRWSTYFGRNIPTEIRRSIFDNRFFALIGHFRVLLYLCFKTSLSAKLSSACSFIFMQIKVVFIRMVSHLDSL